MAFSFSGGVLTITETETEATAFAGTFNNPVGDSGTYIDRIPSAKGVGNYIYRFKSVKLNITGTFIVSSSCIFTPPNTATYWPVITINGGTFTAGGLQTIYSVQYGTANPIFLEFKRDALLADTGHTDPWRYGGQNIQVINGGNCNLYGVTLYYKEGNVIGNRDSSGTAGSFTTATINIRDSKIVCYGTINTTEDEARFLLGGAISGAINNLEYIGRQGDTGFFELDGLAGLTLNNIKFRHLLVGFQFNNAVNGQTFSGLDFRGNGAGIRINQTSYKFNNFLDTPTGNATPVTWRGTEMLGGAGLQATLSFEGSSGGSAINPKFYLLDTNNGNRATVFSANNIYQNTLSGGVFNQVVTTGIYNKSGTGSSTAIDNRLPLTGRARLYNYVEYPLVITSSLAQSVPIAMLVDSNITVTNKATVDAYSGFTFNSGASNLTLAADLTNAQIYDRIRSYLVDNMAVPIFGAFTKIANRLTIDWNLTLSAGLSAGGTVAFTGSILDLTTTATQARVFEIGVTQIVTVTNGTTNLTAWTFASGSQINLRSGATAATIQVSASQLANITAGAGVTLAAPPSIVEVSVQGPSEYYVTIEQTGSRLNTADTGIKTGNYTFETSTTGLATVRIRKQGWRTFSTVVELDGSTVQVNARLGAKVDVVGDNLYDGTTSSICSIFIDPLDLNHRIDIGNGTVNAQTVFDELEDASVSPAGMLVDNLTNYNYARVDGLPRALGLPLEIKARSDNASNVNPAIRGALFHAGDAPVDGVNGPVRVIERLGDWNDQELLEIRYRLGIDGDTTAPLLNEPNLGSGSLTAEQSTQLAQLWATLESSGVFSAESLANLASGTSAQSIWEYSDRSLTDKSDFSLSSTAITDIEAALINDGDGQQLIDAILQVINSNLDLPPLELAAIAQAVRNEISIELARLDVAVGTRLATADYIAPDNLGIAELQNRLTSVRAGYLDKLNLTGDLANTSNADLFKADVSNLSTFDPLVDVVSRVSLVDVTTTNTDMRGTNNALLSLDYVAPDNSTISDISTQLPNYFSNLIIYGDANWSNDLSTIEANIGLLLDKNLMTLNKPILHTPNSIVIGDNEVVIDVVVDEANSTVTSTRVV